MVDLFCGVGALSYGLKRAGFKILAAYDTDAKCKYAFEPSNDATFYARDVADLKAKDIIAQFLGKVPSVLAGCVPCQLFSTYKQRHAEDPRWGLVGVFARLAAEVKPDFVQRFRKSAFPSRPVSGPGSGGADRGREQRQTHDELRSHSRFVTQARLHKSRRSESTIARLGARSQPQSSREIAMLKQSLLTLAAMLAATASFAAAPNVLVRSNGVIVTPDRLTIAPNRPRPVYSQAPAVERGLTKIFDNLSRYPDGVYWCCTSSLISGPNSEFGSQVWIGAPFTPSANSTVSKIVLGLNYDSGTNAMVVAINKDSGGLPGQELASARVSGLPDFPSCCAVAQAKFQDVPLTAGQQYWVVVRTDKKTADTFGGWSFNDTEQVNEVTEAINDGTGWQPLQSLAAAAFEVLGK